MIIKLTQRQKNALNQHWTAKARAHAVVCEPRIVGGHMGYLRVMFLNYSEATMAQECIARIKKARKEGGGK